MKLSINGRKEVLELINFEGSAVDFMRKVKEGLDDWKVELWSCEDESCDYFPVELEDYYDSTKDNRKVVGKVTLNEVVDILNERYYDPEVDD